jgi:hypothetical protein
MLTMLALFLVTGPAVAPALPRQSDLSLDLSITTSEHSRDSSSNTKRLTLSGKVLTYEETYHGARASRHPAIKKEYQLTDADYDSLIGLLRDKTLLRTRSISKTAGPDGPRRDFELRIAAKLDGRQGLISIQAPRSANRLKSDPYYQKSVQLIVDLYRIINRTNPDLARDELID